MVDAIGGGHCNNQNEKVQKKLTKSKKSGQWDCDEIERENRLLGAFPRINWPRRREKEGGRSTFL